MRAIRDGKLYDTDTAEKIFSFCRKVAGKEIAWLPGYCFVRPHEIDIYRTKSGAFFEYDIDAGDITPITEYAATDVIRRLDADRYIELFGEVPEA